ncbi:DNA-binding protein [Streptomyces sp. NPDC088725]|uniref:DNA-binding protein n=1 Tax=Streptomyces sp. NPDC088725 TaxID=3365873 RepID=UPI00381A0840
MATTARTLLKLLVDQRNWSYKDFSRAFERTAVRLLGTSISVSEATYRRWTAGKLQSLPSTDARRVLQEMFDTPVNGLFQEPGTQVAPTTSSPTPDLESEIAMTAHAASNDAGATAAQSISDMTVDQLRDDLVTLARQYHELSPLTVFRKARSLRTEAEHQRDLTRVPQQQQELLIAAGQACALLSQAAFDMGALEDATRLARSAALYAETARFTPLRAYAQGSLAICFYFTGRPGHAVRLVREALSYPGLGDVGRRRLFAIEARAHGHLGDHDLAHRALHASANQAQGLRDDLHDSINGEFGFAEERLVMSNGTTCLLLEDGQGAETAAQRALALLNARPTAHRSVSVRGKAAADLASAMVLKRDVDAAAEILETVWAVPPEKRVAGLLERTNTLRVALSAPAFQGSQIAHQLAERVEDFSRLASQQRLNSANVLAIES